MSGDHLNNSRRVRISAIDLQGHSQVAGRGGGNLAELEWKPDIGTRCGWASYEDYIAAGCLGFGSHG